MIYSSVSDPWSLTFVGGRVIIRGGFDYRNFSKSSYIQVQKTSLGLVCALKGFVFEKYPLVKISVNRSRYVFR